MFIRQTKASEGKWEEKRIQDKGRETKKENEKSRLGKRKI